MKRLIVLILGIALAAAFARWLQEVEAPAEPWAAPGPEPAPPAAAAPSAPPAAAPKADATREELYEEATRLGVKGRSKMNKKQLLEAIAAASSGAPE